MQLKLLMRFVYSNTVRELLVDKSLTVTDDSVMLLDYSSNLCLWAVTWPVHTLGFGQYCDAKTHLSLSRSMQPRGGKG